MGPTKKKHNTLTPNTSNCNLLDRLEVGPTSKRMKKANGNVHIQQRGEGAAQNVLRPNGK